MHVDGVVARHVEEDQELDLHGRTVGGGGEKPGAFRRSFLGEFPAAADQTLSFLVRPPPHRDEALAPAGPDAGRALGEGAEAAEALLAPLAVFPLGVTEAEAGSADGVASAGLGVALAVALEGGNSV